MNRITTIKLALIVIAGVFLVAGMRSDNPTLRWIGIAFLVAAFALRFLKSEKSS